MPGVCEWCGDGLWASLAYGLAPGPIAHHRRLQAGPRGVRVVKGPDELVLPSAEGLGALLQCIEVLLCWRHHALQGGGGGRGLLNLTWHGGADCCRWSWRRRRPSEVAILHRAWRARVGGRTASAMPHWRQSSLLTASADWPRSWFLILDLPDECPDNRPMPPFADLQRHGPP